MKAAYIEKLGKPDVICMGDLPTPTPTNDEVLTRVICTTVNHVDAYIRSGKYRQKLPHPFIIGRDFCGEVIAVGKDVHNFQIGDRVWSNCQGILGKQGTFAEYLTVKEDSLFHLPDGVDPFEAIAVFHSAFTAILGLHREAALKAGETIYVHGSAGNVGAAVIQTAKVYGAHVIASTHGAEKMAYCHQLGADQVLDYRADFIQDLKKRTPKGIDVFWNTSRHHDLKAFLPLLAPKGRYILMAGAGMDATFSVGDLYTRDASIRGYAITNASLEETQQAAHEINRLLKQGALKAKIAEVLPLDKTQYAHERMETDEPWGKLVIKL